jgi:glycosyltransferase involved in cell wall biosynthesis
MQVHWFSPLPPDPTEIAHFSVGVIRQLATLCDVVVWTDTKAPLPSLLPPEVAIRHFQVDTPDYVALNRADVIIYNLGNNGPFHAGIYHMSQKVPGVVLLHEADLQGLFAYLWLTVEKADDRYLSFMRDRHGTIGEYFARARLRSIPLDDLAHHYPIAKPALDNALGIISHSKQVTQLAHTARLPVKQLALPFNVNSIERPRSRSGPIRLVQFGYLNPRRKLDEIFGALSQHPMRSAFRFDIFGRLWDSNYVAGRIRDLGLEDIVQLQGFVDEPTLDLAIAGADMVFNLRFPLVGEASATQLRVWSDGAPSIVTDSGWFGELPSDAVLKVPPGSETASIRTILDALLTDRHQYDRLGERGREILSAEHTSAAYATGLYEFISRAPEWEARLYRDRTAAYLRRRSTS